jgi:REP element-mobilizing transposase RayT
MTHREFHRRHLPHWQPSGGIFFVTFRLKGSLPYAAIGALQQEKEREEQRIASLPEDQRAIQQDLNERRQFGRWDSLLDKAESGTRWLAQPEIAEIVKEALHYRDTKDYDLFAFCVMTNHVHVVFKPLTQLSESDCQSDLPDLPLDKIMQSLKRRTARKANLILGREGAFWQDESYDHVIRDNEEFNRIVHYVLENPVKAGLVNQWKDWAWSYCKSDW